MPRFPNWTLSQPPAPRRRLIFVGRRVAGSGPSRGPLPPPALLLLPAILLLAGAAGAQDDDLCLSCHAAGAEVLELAPRYQVDGEAWPLSIHAEMGFACADCHAGKEDFPHEEGMPPASCADCHAEAAEDFARSVHGVNRREGGEASPWPGEGDPCGVCHGVHDVRAVADPESRVHPRNVPDTCGSCHGNLAIVQAQGLSTAPFDNYQQSVHGLKRDDPDANPAVCTSCHGAHLVLLASDPESSINPFRIPETCGQCHGTEAAEYLSSVHGEAFQRGVSAAPNCTDCHGIHSIKMVPHDDASPLEERLVRSTCPACHASEALMSEYGAAPARVRTYQASYHGLALKRGTTAVADCASCHGIHAIYPSSDPRSTVAPANLQATCGGCHPGASVEFARNPVHFDLGGEATIDVVITQWVKRIYWALILLVLGGMLVHNGVILSYYVRRRARHEAVAPGRRRFSRAQIAQHAVLTVTFVALAVTGFMLAYPDVWWSRLLAGIGFSEAVRRWVHRGAAIGLMVAAVYHLIWIFGTPYGRAELRRIAPRLRDLREMTQNLRFHLGASDRPAAFAKYDYPAKVEYWALVWGTLIMAVTGLVLWFPVWFTSFLPFWIVKVSEVIHLFEAWLATLAILFFHFFYVMGHPEVYPLSLAMIRGTMTEEEARHRHPAWTDDPPPPASPEADPA